MHDTKPKKLIALFILEILYFFSNEKNRLSQKDIMDILFEKYNIEVDRKTIKSNLEDLINAGYSISYEEKNRFDTKNNEKIKVKNNFYYEHDITDGEIHLLIEGIKFSKQVPLNYRIKLIDKLKKLSSKNFISQSDEVNSIKISNNLHLSNFDLFLNFELLESAIKNGKKVSFKYYEYKVNSHLQLEFKPKAINNVENLYLINPYKIVSTNGKYYLICNNQQFDNVSHYRIDRITDLKITTENVRNIQEIEELISESDVNKYLQKHVYMLTGKSVVTTLKIKKNLLNDFIDWFGIDNTIFESQTESTLIIKVDVNRNSIRKWALQYLLHVQIIAPQSLVEEIKSDILQGLNKYQR